MTKDGKEIAVTQEDVDLRKLTADIVAAFVGRNQIEVRDVPGLVQEVYGALTQLHAPANAASEQHEPPAVSVRRSVRPEGIVCLEDGKKFKTLKRHLKTAHNLTPDEYRTKWGLAEDYPLVAPNYSDVRSTVAKKIGLGKISRDSAETGSRGRTRRGKGASAAA